MARDTIFSKVGNKPVNQRVCCTGGSEKMGLEKMGQGWKNWDKVGKNGTTFVLQNFVGKWDKFLSTNFSEIMFYSGDIFE